MRRVQLQLHVDAACGRGARLTVPAGLDTRCLSTAQVKVNSLYYIYLDGANGLGYQCLYQELYGASYW